MFRLIPASCIAVSLALTVAAAAAEPPASASPVRRIRVSIDDDRTAVLGEAAPRRIRVTLEGAPVSAVLDDQPEARHIRLTLDEPTSASAASTPVTGTWIRTDLDAAHPTIWAIRPPRRLRTTLE